MGVPVKRALLFGVYVRAPDLWKLPHDSWLELLFSKWGKFVTGTAFESEP